MTFLIIGEVSNIPSKKTFNRWESKPDDHGWKSISDFIIDVTLRADSLSSFMLGFVAPVSFLIHVYATGYMNRDKSYGRFFAYFNLFIFFMFLLVLADSPFIMFIGWEGVGLVSYALISFYFEDIKSVRK